MNVLFWDKETRSPVDLNKSGVEVYAEHRDTSCTMVAGAFDDAPIFGFLVDPYSHAPQCDASLWERICAHVAAGLPVIAHNASFELAMWRMLTRRLPLGDKIGWPELKPEQVYCTMAQCHVMSLPGKLEQAAKALRLSYEKDMVGHAIMRRLCKPRKDGLWNEDPADVLRELEYCKKDVEVEREIYKRLPQLSERERAYWLIDREINDRGLGIDLENAAICQAAAVDAQDALAAELFELSEQSVKTPSSHKAFREWLAANGSPLSDLRRPTVDRAIETAHHRPDVLRALEIRREYAKSSTSKLKAMLTRTCADGRARGLLTYNGTGTGRPTGRGIQPTNMPRTPEEFTISNALDIFSWLRVPGGEQAVALQYGSVLDAISWSLRAIITAQPGNRLIAADYSNIEGRVQAWLAGEEWKLRAFRQYDKILDIDGKGKPLRAGPDLYVLAYSKMFGVPVETVTKDQRQNIGKVGELLLQYGGAHGAILNMFKAGVRKYRWNGQPKGAGSTVDELTAAVKAAVPQETWEDAIIRYWKGAHETAEEVLEARRLEIKLNRELFGEEPDAFEPDFFDVMKECAKKNRHGLMPDQWAAIRIIVDGWRQANPAICAFWKALERAAIAAVEQPETIHHAGRIAYCKSGDFLGCRLPSGRKIWYPYAYVRYETKTFKRLDGTEYEYTTPKLFYEGFDAKHRWGLQYAYGGSLANNVTQGTARCVQADSHHRLKAADYPIVLHVYDENVCELPNGQGSLDDLCRIMSQSEPWADGLPVAVAGWVGSRYRKG